MRAMVLDEIHEIEDGRSFLRSTRMDRPEPGRKQVRIAVSVCGVCHTELDEIEGRTPVPRLPVVPGHQVVGRVEAIGSDCETVAVGDRVGVAWIHAACGVCDACREGRENLCPAFVGTGRDVHGGYAEAMIAPEDFVHPVPDALSDRDTAPLLCAGAVGHRALKACELEGARRLGLTGFGASGHLVLALARAVHPDSEIFVFARRESTRDFARSLGADWAGATEDTPPAPLDAIIDTTPAWTPVLAGLAALRPGGRLVVNAISKEVGDVGRLTEIDYVRHLWGEKQVRSVANVTRADVREFLDLAARHGIRAEVEEYGLEDAEEVLRAMRAGGGRGAKVLRVSGDARDG